MSVDTQLSPSAGPARAPAEDARTVELSIVIPCLDEAGTIGTCIDKARQFLSSHGVAGEVIVADNGSADGSQRLAERKGARVVTIGARGYGSALMGGIMAARGEFVIMGDGDDSYDFLQLEPFLEKLRAGYDLVMGNRFAGGIQPGAMPFLNRYVGNPALSTIGRLLFRSPVGDFHCGLRAFRKAAALRMDLRTSGMEFASELVVKAVLLGMRVTEVPTTLSPSGRTRRPHLRPWRDGWRHLRFLLIYSPRWLFFYPGAALMGAGMAVAAWVLPGPRMIGGVTYDVHTLLYACMAVVIGFQAASFAAFTKVFAMSEGLLPNDPLVKRFFRARVLEIGLAIGALCIMAGLAGSGYAVRLWETRAFGPLDATRTLRLVIPSAALLVIGCQLALSSFFLSILWLRRHRSVFHPPERAPAGSRPPEEAVG
jgi:hypothetical protein